MSQPPTPPDGDNKAKEKSTVQLFLLWPVNAVYYGIQFYRAVDTWNYDRQQKPVDALEIDLDYGAMALWGSLTFIPLIGGFLVARGGFGEWLPTFYLGAGIGSMLNTTIVGILVADVISYIAKHPPKTDVAGPLSGNRLVPVRKFNARPAMPAWPLSGAYKYNSNRSNMWVNAVKGRPHATSVEADGFQSVPKTMHYPYYPN